MISLLARISPFFSVLILKLQVIVFPLGLMSAIEIWLNPGASIPLSTLKS
jgi:hypothetical protein